MKKCKKYCEEGCGALKLALIITGSIVAAALGFEWQKFYEDDKSDAR